MVTQGRPWPAEPVCVLIIRSCVTGGTGKAMSGKRVLAVAVCSAAASIAAVAAAPAALAVTPKAGSYVQEKNGREQMMLQVKNGHIINAVHYDNCVTVPIFSSALGPNIKINNGKFSWTGKVTDVANRRWTVHVDGAFVSNTKAKGHWSATRLSGGSCTSTFTYSVTRTS